MAKKPLRVGFDLDGVLLYNPARIARFPVSIFKRVFFKKKRLKFYIPKKPWAKLMWRVFHWSSLFVANGFEDIKKLAENGNIEAYIVTSRYSFLEDDFEAWLDRMKINHAFKGVHQNLKDEQPHLFKERMVNELKLDVFVEDNFDIVNHLSKKTRTKIYWIYNILDSRVDYPFKFSSLNKAIAKLTSNIQRLKKLEKSA